MNVWKKIGALTFVIVLALSLCAMAGATAIGSDGTVDNVTDEIAVVNKAIKAFNPNSTSVYSPTIDYTYTIAPGSASKTIKDSNGAQTTTQAGVDETSVVITASENDGTTHNKLTWSPTNTTSTVTASASGTDNTKTISFDFSNVKFTGVGVYRYTITEAATYTNTGVDDVSNGNEVLYLDVYVKQSDSFDANASTDAAKAANYDVYGFALFNSDSDFDGTGTVTGKVNQFTTDTYYTYDVSITKSLVGDNGNITHQFPFGIAFSGSVTGVLPQISGTASITTVPTWSTAGAITDFNILASAGTLKIANSGTVTITGIPVSSSVTINEKNDTTGVTYAVTSTNASTNFASLNLLESEDSTSKTGATDHAVVTADTTTNFRFFQVTVTNTFVAISPTGVTLRYAPYFLTLGAGVVALPLTRSYRRREED